MGAEHLEGTQRVGTVLTVARASAAVGERLVLLHQMPMDGPERAETRCRLLHRPLAQQRGTQGLLDLRLIGWRRLPRRV